MTKNARFESKWAYRSASLYERIQADDEDIQDYGSSDELVARVRSIKRNLVHVLNARAGGSASAPDFGLIDLNDANVGSADMLRQISNQILQVVTKYEPRIDNVRVNFERDQNVDTELKFYIAAQTKIEHKSEKVTIDLVLVGNRGFEIR